MTSTSLLLAAFNPRESVISKEPHWKSFRCHPQTDGRAGTSEHHQTDESKKLSDTSEHSAIPYFLTILIVSQCSEGGLVVKISAAMSREATRCQ